MRGPTQAAGFYLSEGLDGSEIEARVDGLDMQIAEIDCQLADLRSHKPARAVEKPPPAWEQDPVRPETLRGSGSRGY